jgi:hypothetical protein
MFEPRVLASFTRRSDASAAISGLASRFPDGDPRMGGTDDALDVLALGQEAEVSESMPVLSSGIFTGPFARGALIWGSVGIVIGALVGSGISFLLEPAGVSAWALAAACAFAGALAVSSATFVLGAGRQAVKEGATTPEDPTAVVRVDVGEHVDADEVLAFLVDAGARSARLVDHPVTRRPASDVEAPRPTPRGPSAETKAESDAGFTSDVP